MSCLVYFFSSLDMCFVFFLFFIVNALSEGYIIYARIICLCICFDCVCSVFATGHADYVKNMITGAAQMEVTSSIA